MAPNQADFPRSAQLVRQRPAGPGGSRERWERGGKGGESSRPYLGQLQAGPCCWKSGKAVGERDGRGGDAGELSVLQLQHLPPPASSSSSILLLHLPPPASSSCILPLLHPPPPASSPSVLEAFPQHPLSLSTLSYPLKAGKSLFTNILQFPGSQPRFLRAAGPQLAPQFPRLGFNCPWHFPGSSPRAHHPPGKEPPPEPTPDPGWNAAQAAGPRERGSMGSHMA